MVEAQHVASTMKLVDTREEQDLLEALVESAKPALPAEADLLDFLLATPFRYPPPRGGSRFRGELDPGVLYAAGSVRTAGAELGYWRWRFLTDSIGLESIGPVAHTAFRLSVRAASVDLRAAPFSVDAARWRHPGDYSGTQAFGRVARQGRIGAIVYASVRDPDPGWCVAVLSPAALAHPRPHPDIQTWFLAVSRQGASWRRDREAMQFDSAFWSGEFR